MTNLRVLLGGTKSDWIRLYQGVKQGGITSMLLYISFINGLLIELTKSNLGTVTLGVNTDNAGFADDMSLISNFEINMQCMLNIVTRYSRTWRFDFGIDKCASLVFNYDTIPNFILCDQVIKSVTEYVHIGVPVFTKNSVSKQFINDKIDACRRKFYALVGCSLYKTTLSPPALAKIFISVVISKLIYGAEVREFKNPEIVEYDKFHKHIAKSIQCLPSHAPNCTSLANLGWLDIPCLIIIKKLLYVHQLLRQNFDSTYRILFLRRLFYISISQSNIHRGPVAEVVKYLIYYDLLNELFEMIITGHLCTKSQWKKMIYKCVSERSNASW